MIQRPHFTEVDLVLYHGRCPDGSCSRWAAESMLGDRSEYLPAYHGTDFGDVSGRNVAILDFAVKRSILERVISTAKSVIVLDHHVSSNTEIGDIDCVEIGQHGPSSGASMAWDFFHPGIPRPHIVEQVRMCDTFSWPDQLTRQRAEQFMTWFNEQDYSLGLYEDFAGETPTALFDSRVLTGKALTTHDHVAIKRMASGARDIFIQGFPAKIVNCTHMRSQVATFLYESTNAIVGVTYTYDDAKDSCSFSFRADPLSIIDLTKTVKQFPGGGGHATACGFTVSGQYNPAVMIPIFAKVFDV